MEKGIVIKTLLKIRESTCDDNESDVEARSIIDKMIHSLSPLPLEAQVHELIVLALLCHME